MYQLCANLVRRKPWGSWNLGQLGQEFFVGRHAVFDGRLLGFADALEQMMSRRWYAGPRFVFQMMMIFEGVGLALVTVGVYSVLGYTTQQKTHGMGIRMALGAERATVLYLVISKRFRLVAIGVAIGLAVSLILGRVVGLSYGPK